jgi:hypothetical protein
MKNFSALLFLFFDVRPGPVNLVSWTTLIVLLGVIFVLAVSFAAGLVFLLIRLKQRKAKQIRIAHHTARDL